VISCVMASDISLFPAVEPGTCLLISVSFSSQWSSWWLQLTLHLSSSASPHEQAPHRLQDGAPGSSLAPCPASPLAAALTSMSSVLCLRLQRTTEHIAQLSSSAPAMGCRAVFTGTPGQGSSFLGGLGWAPGPRPPGVYCVRGEASSSPHALGEDMSPRSEWLLGVSMCPISSLPVLLPSLFLLPCSVPPGQRGTFRGKEVFLQSCC
jgi:hypothetical protein